MTEQTKRTPGPWVADAVYVYGPNDVFVAQCATGSREDYANAAFIAAAPVMYDALQDAAQIIAKMELGVVEPLEAFTARQVIDYALALARGEHPYEDLAE